MHLHFLRELSDRFEIAAICDLSADSADALRRRVRGARRLHRLARDAARAPRRGARADLGEPRADRRRRPRGPGCTSSSRSRCASPRARRWRWSTRRWPPASTLMVGYPKRYDPAFARFRDGGRGARAAAAAARDDHRVAVPALHRRTTRSNAPGSVAARGPGAAARGLGPASASRRSARTTSSWSSQYQAVLLDTLVHEINTVRGVLGEPARLDYVDMRPGFARGHAQLRRDVAPRSTGWTCRG